ncbi:MAG: phosphoserine phosphatase SerB [Desulfobacterales bacterium]|nr:phosphoserine phosphatase SerB [Desulfobacterales bacterium]
MNSLYIISAVGKDRPGLVSIVSDAISKLNINIVDVDARAIRGHFSMFLVVDLSTSKSDFKKMLYELEKISSNFNLGIRTDEYRPIVRNAKKRLYILTMIGNDKPGLVASISGFLSFNSVNIEIIRMIARGAYIAMELTIDVADIKNLKNFRQKIYKHAKEIEMDVSLIECGIHSKPKKVILFDCDSTIIQQEIIDEIGKLAGVEKSIKTLTSDAMKGNIDFEHALVKRVKLLKGLKAEKLQNLIQTIEMTPGAEELISVLRFMGYKIGIISGGFSFFTDYLKESLSLDFVFANELEIQDNIVTGKIVGEIITAERKGEILKEIAIMENISVDQIVAVGDGSNDRFMLDNAGLAIGFNPKEILKDYSDGIITSKNISGLLYFLGVPESNVNNIK